MQDHPARILVVDDDASFGRMVAGVLTGRGYEVVALTDPAEPLRAPPARRSPRPCSTW